MTELWFGIVSVMLTMFVVMDGYDLGAGALHLLVARNDDERRRVLAAIGPYWDANEVWLIATGGALFVAFPKVLASGLSGFYLAIFLVLWCLLLRGIGRCRAAARVHPLHRAQHRHDNEHYQSCDAMPRTELVNGAPGKPQKVLLSGHDGLRV